MKPEAMTIDTVAATSYQEEKEKKGVDWLKLAKVLRIVGALILGASAITFLFQGWANGSSLLRYYSFLGFTMLLTTCGFVSGVKLKDPKAARTFLGVVLSFLAVPFAQLGSFTYSHAIGGVADVPNLFLFQAPSMLVTVLTTGLSYVLLSIAAYAGFSVLARGQARALTFITVLSSSLLLIPVRAPSVIACLAVALFVALLVYDRSELAKVTELHTFEGRLSRTVPFAPVLILLVRNFLYPPNAAFIGALALMVGYVLFKLIPRACEDKGVKEFFQVLSIPAFAVSYIAFGWQFFFSINGLFQGIDELFIPLLCFPVSLVVAAMSFFVEGTGRNYRRLAVIIAVLAAWWQIHMFSGVGSSMFLISIALATLITGVVMEEKWSFFGGVLLLCYGIIRHLHFAFELFNMAPWVSLAILGVVIIFATTQLERSGAKLSAYAENVKRRLQMYR